MKCRFPVAEVDGITIAILLAETFKEHLGLILHPAANHELQDPSLNLYCVGWLFEVNSQTNRFCRLAYLGNDLYNLRFRGKTYQARWRDLYIHASPRETDEADPARRLLLFGPDGIPDTPFRVPRWLIGALSALLTLATNAAATAMIGLKTWCALAMLPLCTFPRHDADRGPWAPRGALAGGTGGSCGATSGGGTHARRCSGCSSCSSSRARRTASSGRSSPRTRSPPRSGVLRCRSTRRGGPRSRSTWRTGASSRSW